MKRCLLAFLFVAFAVQPSMAAVPKFFMDFDPDGEADNDPVVSRVDLGLFEPAILYVGVKWVGHDSPGSEIGMAAAEYQVIYNGLIVPSVVAHAETGAPPWALTIGNLLDGGWFQSGPCRDANPEFIAALSVTGLGGTGTPEQTFDFAPTSAPYDFPGLDPDIRRLSGYPAPWLMDEDSGGGQDETFSRGSAGQKQRSHGGCLAQADRLNIRFDVLDGVVDSQPGGNRPTG